MFRSRTLVGLSALFVIQILIISFYSYHSSLSWKRSSWSMMEDVFDLIMTLGQEDPLVLGFAKRNHVFPPSSKAERFKPQSAMTQIKSIPGLANVLNNSKEPGFFVECGANDGEFLSNTLDLEINYNWTGLLIEGSPSLFKKLNATNRKAWLSNVCLSGRRPERIEFLKHKDVFPAWRIGNGKVNPGAKYDVPSRYEVYKREDYISEGMVNCFPLYSILAAINVPRVDFFSLDVEGHEYKILEAIPFDKIHIEVIFVEHWIAPEGKLAIRTLLENKSYTLVSESDSDYLFKRNSK